MVKAEYFTDHPAVFTIEEWGNPVVCRFNQWIKWIKIFPLLAGIVFSSLPAQAQIVPDGTLGAERSQVTANPNLRGLPGLLIQGGARRGVNLFQSFADFNVGNGQRVYFANPTGVENILSRVTGRNPSNILGTLGVNGAANLFLLNPNGILFGANARLDIAGSFVASTSDRFDFGNGQSFNAVNPNAPPLLTIALRPGLQYGSNYQGNITNAGNLAVGAGQTLSLAGKEVTMTGSLSTSGGTVQVLGDRLSLLDHARVDVSGFQGGTILIGGDYQGQGSLPTATTTLVSKNVSLNADGETNGGRVIVWANDSTRFDGSISARGGNLGGDGGFVEVSGKRLLDFTGRVDTTAVFGKPGSLLLDPDNIVIVDGAFNPGELPSNGGTALLTPDFPGATSYVSNQTIAQAGANVFLQAGNTISFNAPIRFQNAGVGLTAEAGRDITVNADIITRGGDVKLTAQAGNLTINGATIDTNIDFTAGTIAGNVELTAGNQVAINGGSIDARSNNGGSTFNTIKISGGSVSLNGAYVTTTNVGGGIAGDVAITARDRVSMTNGSGVFARGDQGRILIGTSDYFPTSPNTIQISNSQLRTNNDVPGNGTLNVGAISLHATSEISLTNGTEIDTSTFRSGDAGNVFLRTDGGVISLDNSDVFSTVESGGKGDSGYIRVDTGSLVMTNGSQLQTLVRGGGQGDPGVILVFASDTVSLSGVSPNGFPTAIFSVIDEGAVGGAGSNTQFGGGLLDVLQGDNATKLTGTVGIFADNVFLSNGAAVNVSTFGQGNAGSVLVSADQLISLRGNSSIFSAVAPGLNQTSGAVLFFADSIHLRDRSGVAVDNAGTGLAGAILMAARGIWLDNQSYISAESTSGLGGDILINTYALILGRNSSISATSGFFGTSGSGGNIAIGRGNLISSTVVRDGRTFTTSSFDDRSFIIAGQTRRDNNILARAFTGVGGNIRINTFRLQDIAERPDLTIRNDISTESTFGLSGSTVVNFLNVFPSVRVDPLPVRYDVPRISQGCDPRVRQETSTFVITGRGGLPTNPTEVLTPDTLATSGASTDAIAHSPVSPSPTEAIVPARGWIVKPNGEVWLTAQTTESPAPLPQYLLEGMPAGCQP